MGSLGLLSGLSWALSRLSWALLGSLGAFLGSLGVFSGLSWAFLGSLGGGLGFLSRPGARVQAPYDRGLAECPGIPWAFIYIYEILAPIQGREAEANGARPGPGAKPGHSINAKAAKLVEDYFDIFMETVSFVPASEGPRRLPRGYLGLFGDVLSLVGAILETRACKIAPASWDCAS